jgi:hypothetical protein
MPNWVENELTITIDKKGHPSERNKRIKILDRFIIKARDPKHTDIYISAEQFIPYPKEWKIKDIARRKKSDEINALPKEERIAWFKNNQLPEDGYNHGGYDWCLINWGTKWNFSNTTPPIDKEPGKIIYKFETAWSPPYPLIRKMSVMFPELIFTLKYWESGMGFKGVYKLQSNNTLIDKNSAYKGWRGG